MRAFPYFPVFVGLSLVQVGVRLFYAAALLLSMMLGKNCFASTSLATPPAAKASAESVATLSLADREFLLAHDAYSKLNLKSLAAARENLSTTFQQYPLSAYIEAWWLLAQVSQSTAFAESNANAFRTLLDAQPDSVLADSLRREWLRALAKQERWALFAGEYPRLNVDDADLTCHHWRYRQTQNDRSAQSEALAAWNAARPATDACYSVFAELRDAKLIGTDLAWSRVRRLLDDNQLADARRSAAFVDNLPATFERNTAAVGLNPAAFLEREKLNPKSRASIELFRFALNRVARSDAAKAAAQLEKRGGALPVAERESVLAQIAHYGAMQHDATALVWFQQAGSAPLNDLQAGWKARAALREQDWPALRQAIGAMSSAEKRDPAWRYWLARADVAQGNLPNAAKARTELSRENNFYGLLAAEELGETRTVNWTSWKPAATDLAGVENRPGVVRALTFYRLGLKNEGLREWQYAIRNMSDQELLAAAEVARQANVPDRAIGTADRTVMLHDFTQRFPLPHRDALQAQARIQGIDEAWVYGLIRQESRFMADAKSRVGATGLMQLMPATAKWAAKQVGMKPFLPQRIGDIPTNLALGSFYLKHVLDDLGHPVLATAAYNAGPGRARRWRADQALEGAIYAESSPFTETRDYVKRVMTNAWFYTRQFGGTLSLREMLGTVPGRSDVAAGKSSLVAALAAAAARE